MHNKRQCGTHLSLVDSCLCEFVWRQGYRKTDLFHAHYYRNEPISSSPINTQSTSFIPSFLKSIFCMVGLIWKRPQSNYSMLSLYERTHGLLDDLSPGIILISLYKKINSCPSILAVQFLNPTLDDHLIE